MGESNNMELLLQSHPSALPRGKLVRAHHSWMIMEEKEDLSNNMSSASSSFDSNGTSTSDDSSDLADDASSSPSSRSSAGPLYELSDLMAHLPIKRGLSKHYNGKSQSFTSLSKVVSVEDLGKKERFCRRKMKACKSMASGLDRKLSPTSPKPAICKKSSRNIYLPFVCHPTTKISCNSSFALPPSPRQSNLQY